MKTPSDLAKSFANAKLWVIDQINVDLTPLIAEAGEVVGDGLEVFVCNAVK